MGSPSAPQEDLGGEGTLGCTAFWVAGPLEAHSTWACTMPRGARHIGVLKPSGCTTFLGAWHFEMHCMLGCRSFWGAWFVGLNCTLGCKTPWGARHLRVHNTLECTMPWFVWRFRVHAALGCMVPWGGAKPLGVHGASARTAPQGARHFGVHKPWGAESLAEHSSLGCRWPVAPQGAASPDHSPSFNFGVQGPSPHLHQALPGYGWVP